AAVWGVRGSVACVGGEGVERVGVLLGLAVRDGVDRSLLLAGGRFGITPLDVAADDASLAFASELRALVSTGLVPGDIDAAGVLGYLAWGSVPPPLTWIAGAEALAPGTWLRWSADGRREQQPFADLGAIF